MSLSFNAKYIVLHGSYDSIVIVDASTLEIIKSFSTNAASIASICIHSTESVAVEELVCLTFDGRLLHFLFDQSKLEITSHGPVESPVSLNTVNNLSYSSSKLHLNAFDKNIFAILCKSTCLIRRLTHTSSESVTKIDPPTGIRWNGMCFFSARSLMLWNSKGDCFIHYLGDTADLHQSVVKSIPPNDIALLSDGLTAIHVANLAIGHDNYKSYDNSVCIGSITLGLENPAVVLYVPLDFSLGQSQMVLHFEKAGVGSFQLSQTHFWASIYGSNLNGLQLPANSDGLNSSKLHLELKRHCLTSFPDIWRSHLMKNEPCASTAVLRNHMALGYANGTIIVAPIQSAVYLTPSTVASQRLSLEAPIVLHGHRSRITAFHASKSRSDGLLDRLVSGSMDSTIKLWNLNNSTLLATFLGHSMGIASFTPFTTEPQGRFKNSIVSVANDHSVSIIDVEDAICHLHLLPHHTAIQAVHLKSSDDMLVVECVDGTLFVWQIKTGHLDRIITGSAAQEIVSGCDAKAACHDSLFPSTSVNIKKSLSVFSIHDSAFPSFGSSRPMMMVYLVNIKRLIDDVCNGEHSLSPKTANDSAKPSQKLDISNNGASKAHTIPNSTDTTVIQTVFSMLLSWGISKPMDQLCIDKLGLNPTSPFVSIGFRGPNGFISFPVRSLDRTTSLDEWTTSPTTTASRLLQIVSLSRCVLTTKGMQEHIIQLITHYGILLRGAVGEEYRMPSLPYLAKFWQDPVVDVQEAARSLFETCLKGMSEETQTLTIQYWHPQLPSVVKKLNKQSIRAALILGILGCDPQAAFNVRVCRDVAESLDTILKEESRNLYRLIAIELIGKGFSVWEPHVNGTSILRTLVTFTGLVNSAAGASHTQANAGASGGASVQATSESVSSPGISSTVAATVAASGVSTHHPIQPVIALVTLTPALMVMARQALMNIATSHPALFISTLTFDLVHTKNTSDRGGELKLLGLFISRKPAILFQYLPSIVEAMVKTLDPNTPHIRESLQQIVTVNIAELVKAYPTIDFHAKTQRLAVGLSDGNIIIYDLRTATKIFVLVGHVKPVHAVSFSSDGKLIATYSVDENCVKIWQPSSGFLGTLVGAISGSVTGNATGAALSNVGGAGSCKPFRSFNIGTPGDSGRLSVTSILQCVKFEWKSDRSVKLYAMNQFELVFNV